MTLMLAHFTVDMYVGLLPVLYPLLTARFELDLATVGLVSLAYTGTSAVSQPFFGWLADRYGTRFIGAALLWTAAMFSTIGFAPSFPILLLMASLAGLGSGAYHPMGAVSANAVINEGGRNTALSVYVTGGTLGVAMGPLVGALLFSYFGVRGTALMFLPGLSIALWLLYELRSTSPRSFDRKALTPSVRGAPIPVVPMLAVIGVMMSRSWTILSIEAFIPTWYKSLGYGPSFYGPLSTTIVLASAIGAVGCGSLADRFGRRGVTLITLALSVPAVLLLAQFTGPIAFLTAGLVGLLAASGAPLMLGMAQQLITGRAGMASGMVLGLGFVTAAIGVPVMGALADRFGMQNAMRLQAVIVVLTIVIAWLLPTEARMRALQRRSRAVAHSESRPLPGGAAAVAVDGEP